MPQDSPGCRADDCRRQIALTSEPYAVRLDLPGAPPTIPVEWLRKTLSKKVIGHFTNPRNVGEFRNPDGVGRASIPCGDSMQTCLRVSDGRIIEASSITDGCQSVIACGSMATELVRREDDR